MENKQRTPIALAIEELKHQLNRKVTNDSGYERGIDNTLDDCIDILESLKPKEREIINNAFLDGYCHIEGAYIDSNNYCQETLTQE